MYYEWNGITKSVITDKEQRQRRDDVNYEDAACHVSGDTDR